MNCFEIGKLIKQPNNFSAFVPNPFPPTKPIILSREQNLAHTRAVHLLGKLDGVADRLPDKDWFLKMFIRKDASSSSQIEGTNATLMDVIEKHNIEPSSGIPSDVDDILHYVDALNYGIERAETFPFSLRFICELHEKLMVGARSTQFSYPGEFRTSQNWIGGTNPGNAFFVPPPVPEMRRSLNDLEKFVHANDNLPILVKAALIHSQFETIHPFTDGNGRTGRMLITMFLWREKLLGMPILYLSSYFKKNQKLYYDKLNAYHQGYLYEWLDFFIDGIIETAESAIATCTNIVDLRDVDMQKIYSLGKTAAKSTINILNNLYEMPIVGIADIVQWTGFSRNGGYKAINRLVDMGILKPLKTRDSLYGQKWFYANYFDLFAD